LHSTRRLGYIDDADYKRLDALARMVAAPLHGLIRKRRAALVVKTALAIATFVWASPLLR
jgi:hypothetical protein